MTDCVNGCLLDGEHADVCSNPRCPGCLPRPVDDPARWICDSCYHKIATWLEKLPLLYLLLARVLEPGSVPAGSRRRSTGRRGHRVDAPAPLRLVVSDHTDARLGWRSDGTTDRRGAIGLLEAWANHVRDERRLGIPTSPPTITSEATCLTNHLDWIATQPWVDEFTAELRELWRALNRALGSTSWRPLGTCPMLLDDGQPCGQTLWPHRDLLIKGITCPACGASWNPDHLLLLGKIIGRTA